MKKVVRLTESDLTRIVKRVISEQSEVVVNDGNFNKIIGTQNKIVFIDFWATWCGPCLRLGKVFEELLVDKKYKDKILVGKYEFDSFELPIAKKLNIQSIPFVMVYKNGKLIHKFSGFKDKNYLISLINKF
jgi:thioredoxin 1